MTPSPSFPLTAERTATGPGRLARPAAVFLLAALLGARAGWCVSTVNGIGWDFANYHATGSRVARGERQELYRLSAPRMDAFYNSIGEGRGADRIEGWGTSAHSGRMGHIGFPLSAYLFAPLGFLAPRPALLLFKAQSAACLAAALALLYAPFREAARERLGTGWPLPVYLLICLLYEPFWFVFATGGQATPLNLLLLVLFHRYFVQGRPLLASLFLAVGILVKPFFLLLVPVFLLARRWRVLFALAGWGALFGALSLLLFGVPVHLDWLQVMRDAGGGLAEPWWNNSSVLGAVYSAWCLAQHQSLVPAGEPPVAVQVGVGAFKLFVLGLFVVLVRASGRAGLSEQQARHHTVALAVLFALTFSSIVWPHYLGFLFLPLVFLLFSTVRPSGRGAVLTWLILASTLAVQSRFAQRCVLEAVQGQPCAQGVLAVLFGSATLLLSLVFLLTEHSWFLEAGRPVVLFPTGGASQQP